ncbi:MAG: hypothetical protein AB1483_12385 [Candidatus Zixiibacteriota bacterium]
MGTRNTGHLASVVKDWLKIFPRLSEHGNSKIVRRVGPVLIGVEFFRPFSTTYRPEFILVNLMDADYKNPRNVIFQFVRSRNNVQVQIPFDKHEKLYAETAELLRRQSTISLVDDVSVGDILSGVALFLEEDYMKGSNCFIQCKAIIHFAKLLGDQDAEGKWFDFARSKLEELPTDILEQETGGYEIWLTKMSKIGVEDLLNSAQQNITRWRLDRLPVSNLR